MLLEENFEYSSNHFMFKKEINGKTNIKSSKKEAKILVFLFIILATSILLIIFSKLKIEVINFRFTSQQKRHINEDYKVIIKLMILSKIPILKVNITKTKLEKMKLKEKVKSIDIDILNNKNKFDKKVFKALRESNINISKFDLKVEIGTENASMTSIIVPAISTVIAILLQRKIKKFENQTFIMKPVFINKNLINMVFSGIFEIKMIHIINIIYILTRKKGVKKYERTSNRRSYDYSYE